MFPHIEGMDRECTDLFGIIVVPVADDMQVHESHGFHCAAYGADVAAVFGTAQDDGTLKFFHKLIVREQACYVNIPGVLSGMDLPFSEKTALIVGASSGIGLAVARSLQQAGALIRGVGRHAVAGMDMTLLNLDEKESCEKVLEMAAGCDILVVVRGPFFQETLDHTPSGMWESLVYANLVFPGQLVSAALPGMCRKEWGRILLFGGTRTDRVRGFRTNAAYAAAKTGLSSLILSTAQGYASRGITCNGICPGFVDCGAYTTEKRRSLEQKSPLSKLVDEGEIVSAAEFLLKNPSINGTIVRVDQGWSPSFI